jgi:hypothetical protein
MVRFAVRFQSAWPVLFGVLLLSQAARAGVITAPVTPAAITPAAITPLTVFTFTSSPTSWIGQGASQSVGITYAQRNSLGAYANSIEFTTNGGWDIVFAGPSLTLPTPGYYADARRWPFNDTHPGLAFTGNSRGDNNLTGEFSVFQLSFDTQGYVQSFAADFLQNDENNPSRWNAGQLRYNSTVPLPEPTCLAPIAAAAVLLYARRRRCRAAAAAN